MRPRRIDGRRRRTGARAPQDCRSRVAVDDLAVSTPGRRAFEEAAEALIPDLPTVPPTESMGAPESRSTVDRLTTGSAFIRPLPLTRIGDERSNAGAEASQSGYNHARTVTPVVSSDRVTGGSAVP